MAVLTRRQGVTSQEMSQVRSLVRPLYLGQGISPNRLFNLGYL